MEQFTIDQTSRTNRGFLNLNVMKYFGLIHTDYETEDSRW